MIIICVFKGNNLPQSSEQQKTDIEEILSPPRKYKVIMHNDDYSTWEFVVGILKDIFNKSEADAIETTTKIHEKGSAVCGIYTYEIAEIKTAQVHSIAKSNKFPLRCSIEEE